MSSDDIVERLRQAHQTVPVPSLASLYSDAADEIERLHAERDASRLIISDGAWFVYSTDYGYHPLALFGDELSARRWADEHEYGRVVFWPFGMDWKEARHG